MSCPTKKNLKECILCFTWRWYIVVMATGALAQLAHAFPFGYGSTALKYIMLIFFCLNLIFFAAISAATIARYWMYPEVWGLVMKHPAQSLFIGALPMGVMTIINGALIINQDYKLGGTGFLYFLWALWWLNSTISFAIAIGMLHVMMTIQEHKFEKILSLWLLPVTTLTVVSSGGGLLATALTSHSSNHALLTTAVAFTELFIGLSLSVMITTAYLMRLILHGPPGIDFILSAFVVLGPFAQSGFALLVNGHNLTILPLHFGDTFSVNPQLGRMLHSVCLFAAWGLWSIALLWIAVATLSIHFVTSKERPPFTLGYWGLVFPNSVFASLTLQLGVVLNSDFFRYFGAIWTVFVLQLWVVIFIKTIPRILDTTIFVAPGINGALASQPKKNSGEPSLVESGRASEATSSAAVQV